MATGNGTQADPYIVTTFGDLLTCASTTDAYVKLGADIDVSLDTTYREGLTTPITFSCTECDLNSHELKNFEVTADCALSIIPSGIGTTTLKNGKIIDFVYKANSTGVTCVPIKSSSNGYITNVDFSFTQHGYGYSCRSVTYGNYSHCSLYIRNKSHSIVRNDSGDYYLLLPTTMDKCSIYIDANVPAVSTHEYNYASFFNMTNCSVTGCAYIPVDINRERWSVFQGCSNSYCAVEITSANNRTIGCGQTMTGVNFIVTNISPASPGTLTYGTSTAFLGLTSAQAKDANYLYDIGFLP